MHYRIGQTYPLDGGRGIVAGPEIPPIWYALIVPPGKERATREYLRRRGIFAFYPSTERCHHVRGRKICREYPVVSRYVYAQFRQAPQWDVMKERRRLITGVFSIGNWPVEIPAQTIRHLQGLTVEMERLKAERREMLRIREGDKARITEGPLTGFLVDVTQVDEGRVWFDGLFGKGTVDKALIERVLPDGN